MTGTVIRRLAGAALTILAVLTFVFFVIRATGDLVLPILGLPARCACST